MQVMGHKTCIQEIKYATSRQSLYLSLYRRDIHDAYDHQLCNKIAARTLLTTPAGPPVSGRIVRARDHRSMASYPA